MFFNSFDNSQLPGKRPLLRVLAEASRERMSYWVGQIGGMSRSRSSRP